MLDALCMWWMLLLGVQGSEQDAGVGGGGAVASALSLPASSKHHNNGNLQVCQPS